MLSKLWRTWQTALLISFACLFSLISLLTIAIAPSNAAPLTTAADKTEAQQPVEYEEPSYDEIAKEAATDPKVVQEEYEKNLDTYKDEAASGGVVEGAKEVIKKVTGQN